MEAGAKAEDLELEDGEGVVDEVEEWGAQGAGEEGACVSVRLAWWMVERV